MGRPDRLIILVANAFREAGSNLKRVGLVPILSFLPIAYLLVIDAKSFVMAWNQGRGGFLFALALVTIEYFIERRDLEPRTDKRNIILLTASLVVISTYFTLITFTNLQQYLLSLGQLAGVPAWHYSFVWAWDYIMFALYLNLVLALSCGAVGLKKMVAAIVYLFGMAGILLLDAFFPYDALGPLQSIVSMMLQIDLFLLRMVGVGQAFVHQGNILVLPTNRGYFPLAVFWPSAGVHSMIIYSLIMLVFLIKVPLLRSRKVLYFTVGALGTFFVNVFRIFLLSTYVVFVSSEVAKFEQFHATIGEIIFLPWVVGYILIVTWLASRKGA